MPLDEILLIASNIGIVFVTGWLILVSVKEAHRHEERISDADDAEIRKLTAIVEDVVEHKHHVEDNPTK
jgi:hypothetical protein